MSFIEMKNICKKYAGAEKNSVTDFNLSIEEGEFIAFVGPSGCGKSTTLRMIAGFEEITSGDFYIDGKRMNTVLPRARGISMVFQNYALYPHMTVEKNISYGLKNMKVPADEIKKKVDWAIEILELSEYRYRKPKNLSGGQRQRIGIARALSLNPRFLVCDEPVSALDVSIQAQILNLLRSLQKDLGLTCMFVGHGLGAVNYVSDRIAVMYLGKIVEIGPAQEVFHHPVHPYTRALIDAVPIADPKKREQKPLLTGEIGSSTNPPSGCRFHPRCPYATASCRQEVPELCSVFPGSSHLAACPYAIAQLAGGAPAYDAKMQQVVVEQKWR